MSREAAQVCIAALLSAYENEQITKEEFENAVEVVENTTYTHTE